MAHFAQLDENNVVTQVIVVHNNELLESKQMTINEDGTVKVAYVESEQKGIDFCKSLYGADTRWVQTSYNGEFRGSYAGVGDTFENGAFVSPIVELPVVDLTAGFEQQTDAVQTLASEEVRALSTGEIVALTSVSIQTLASADVSALTTSDISSLE
jgi:hypothetical protein